MTNRLNLNYRVVIAYSRALFEISKKDNVTAEIDVALKKIVELFSVNNSFYDFFGSPLITMTDKQQMLDFLVSKYNFNILLKKLLLELLSNNRLSYLNKISDLFNKIFLKDSGKKNIEVISAIELSKEQLAKISAILEKKYLLPIIMVNTVNRDIQGGVIIIDDGVVYDYSLRNRVSKLLTNIAV